MFSALCFNGMKKITLLPIIQLKQNTLLGTYRINEEKIVVTCKEVTVDGKKLMKAAHLKNTYVDSEQSGYGTKLFSIMKAIDEQFLAEPKKLKDFFGICIADAFLGNFDHHNGNWGVLIDKQQRCVEIAPAYDYYTPKWVRQ